MIPQEKIAEVIDRASIVSVVGDYLPLKQRGSNYIGLCPFHSEKTPSFTVNEDKAMFYCFGCHSGGNVIGFVMQKDGAGFVDAVMGLARRFGVRIELDKGAKPSSLDEIYRANNLACDLFYRQLRLEAGAGARAYLKERGITKELADDFKIGLAPSGWTTLTDKLKHEKLSMDDALKAGVVSKKDSRYFDRFRERIMCPIKDLRGRVVAFGGRAIGDEEPKYLNSSESQVFDKSATLFGLSRAKGAISKAGYAIVAEGYFDVIALHDHGFTNSVATMGTALTSKHIKLLRRFAGRIYTIFDGDSAGKKAAIRGIEKFLAQDVMARVVLLPDAMDPDDILRRDGKEALQRLIDDAVPLLEFFCNEFKTVHDLSEVEGKRGFLDEILPYLKMIKNPAEKAHYVEMVSSLLSIKSDALYRLLSAKSGQANPSSSKPSEIKEERPLRRLKGLSAQSCILTIILKCPGSYNKDVGRSFAYFSDPFLKRVALALAEAFDRGAVVDSTTFTAEINDPEVVNWVAGVLLSEDDDFINSPEKMLSDCMASLMNAGKLKEATIEQIRKLEDAGLVDIAEQMRKRASRAVSHNKGGR